MKQRLLVADADFATAALCSTYFSDVGYYVDTAGDGLDCLTKLRRTTPDLLVLDQNLLWGGSQGLLACLREEYQEPTIPVVLLAAFLPVCALSQWLSPPVVRCVQKPFPIAALHDCIDTALGCPRSVPGRHGTNVSDLSVDGVRRRTRRAS